MDSPFDTHRPCRVGLAKSDHCPLSRGRKLRRMGCRDRGRIIVRGGRGSRRCRSPHEIHRGTPGTRRTSWLFGRERTLIRRSGGLHRRWIPRDACVSARSRLGLPRLCSLVADSGRANANKPRNRVAAESLPGPANVSVACDHLDRPGH